MYILLCVIMIITGVLALLYTAMTCAFIFGWIRTNGSSSGSSGSVSIAIVIAVRNEESNIAACLSAVLSQTYPKDKMEIVVVDDHSEDNTSGIVKSFCALHSNLKLIRAEGAGKKAAIATAIKNTRAELIITTDADCTMSSEWIESIVAFYEKAGASMIAGPVSFVNERSFLEKMQELELMAIMGSTAGSLYFDKAIMCNGANLAYKRSVFNQLEGFKGIDGNASGDDVLLMYKVGKTYKSAIQFLKDERAVVYTSPKNSLSDFIEQRKRWASKGFSAFNTETRYVSMIVYFFCFFMILMGILSGLASIKSRVYLPFLEICLILGGIKCIFDFLLLFLAATFFKKRHYLYLFLPGQFIYLFYVVVTGLIGSRGRFEWKGRKY
jgi:cellulose synthase/poly-beta-1,6-N-acetylglucosamine synthase-like glycosyltransferase